MRVRALVFQLALLLSPLLLLGMRVEAESTLPFTLYLPLVSYADPCPTLPESYSTLSITGSPTTIPAAQHPDLNLSMRGYIPTNAYRGLIDLIGPNDLLAPQLYGLFGDLRTPAIAGTSQVYDWDWSRNMRGDPITDPPVTLLSMSVQPGEAIHVPNSGYNIGTASRVPLLNHVLIDDARAGDAYEVLVLYADQNRITLKYTREDNVVYGYTIHVEGICVEPRLRALYQELNRAGRWYLPALRGAQAFGTASGNVIGVAIRDSGSFMEPRSRKDWWQGR